MHMHRGEVRESPLLLLLSHTHTHMHTHRHTGARDTMAPAVECVGVVGVVGVWMWHSPSPFPRHLIREREDAHAHMHRHAQASPPPVSPCLFSLPLLSPLHPRQREGERERDVHYIYIYTTPPTPHPQHSIKRCSMRSWSQALVSGSCFSRHPPLPPSEDERREQRPRGGDMCPRGC